MSRFHSRSMSFHMSWVVRGLSGLAAMVILALTAPVFAAGGTAQVFYDFSDGGGTTSADTGNYGTNTGTFIPQNIGGGTTGGIATGGAFTGPSPSGGTGYLGSGRFGGALWFTDAANQFAQFDATFDISDHGSISFFINHFDMVRRSTYISSNATGINHLTIDKGNNGEANRLYHNAENTTHYNVANNSVAGPNTWNHVVLTWSLSTNTMLLYLNGTVQTGTNQLYFGNIDTLDQFFRFGSPSGSNGTAGISRTSDNASFRFRGGIDDIAFYSSALSASDIAVISTGSAAAVTANQVVYWNLDNSTGTTIAMSNGGSVATNLLTGALTPIVVTGGTATDNITYVVGGGPVLPGSGGTLDAVSFPDKVAAEAVARIVVPDSPTLDWNKSKGTIAMWLNPTVGDVNAGDGVAGEEGTRTLVSDSTGNIEVRVTSGGRVWFKTTSTGGTGGTENWAVTYRLFPVDGQTPLNENIWSHWAFVWDETVAGGTMAIYRNGILMDLANSNGGGCTGIAGSLGGGGRDCMAINPNGTGWTSSSINTGNWFIGARATPLSQQYEGDLADFGMFAEALTLAQIQEIYNFGINSFLQPVEEPQPQPQPTPQPQPASGAVPEPATLSLLTLSIFAIARRRRT